MFTTDKTRYPFLATYLSNLRRRRPRSRDLIAGVAATALGGLMTMSSLGIIAYKVFEPFGYHWGGVFGYAALGVAGLFVTGCGVAALRRAPAKTAEQERYEEAWRIGSLMADHLTSNRLRRELDHGSNMLFDEAARCWGRVMTALESPVMSDRSLPQSYLTARDRIGLAAEEAMLDMILLYRHDVPVEPSQKLALEYVDEALEAIGMKKNFDSRMPPAAFHAARPIAEKLRTLADETERLVMERTSMPFDAVQARSLDVALSELRTIRQAEEELRQDIGQRT